MRLVNQLDIDGLFTPATVVVDYMGRRIVGQSIVPGIFKQREPGENQIDYGAVDGKDVIAADERFVSVFAALSRALRVKKHPIWDKNGQKFDLEASVETKGLCHYKSTNGIKRHQESIRWECQYYALHPSKRHRRPRLN